MAIKDPFSSHNLGINKEGELPKLLSARFYRAIQGLATPSFRVPMTRLRSDFRRASNT
jgi:hypothetical protein